MSSLKTVLHVEKTLKTNIQKNFSKSQKFARKVSVAEFHYRKTIFFAIHSNFTYDSEAYDITKLFWKLHIQSLVKQLRWSFFVEPLVIFAGELHRGCLTGL